MHDKTVVITGAARGMGRETALALAAQGVDRLILIDWQGEEGTRTRDAVNAITERYTAEFMPCDLSSMEEVNNLVDTILASYPKLDVLINNAAIMDPVRRESVDGIEMHMATCHLAHFILSNRLLGALRASGSGRIICISANVYAKGPGLDFDDTNNEVIWDGKRVSNKAAGIAYHRAKLCNLHMMAALHERLQGDCVTVNAVSPGHFVNTTLRREMTGVLSLGAKLASGLLNLKTPAQGAQTCLWLASSVDIEGVSGQYFEACKEKALSELADDAAVREQLWDWSERVSGVSWGDSV